MTKIKNQMWHCLNFSTDNAILKPVNFDTFQKNNNFHVQLHVENVVTYWTITRDYLNQFLNQVWIDQFEQKYAKITNCLVFFRQGNKIYDTCHIDYDKNTKKKIIYAINWCYGVDDAKMIWLKDCTQVGDITEKKDSMYSEWVFDPIEKMSNNVETRIIGSRLTLVNTETPHYIEMGMHDRWCISLRLEESNKIKNWDDAVDYFVR